MGFPDKLKDYNISAIDFDISTINKTESFSFHPFDKDQKRVKEFLKKTKSEELMLIVHSEYQSETKDGICRPKTYYYHPDNDTNVYIDGDYAYLGTQLFVKEHEKLKDTIVRFGIADKKAGETTTDEYKQHFLADFAMVDKGFSRSMFSKGDFEGFIMRFYQNTKEIEKLYFFSNQQNMFVNNTKNFFSVYNMPLNFPSKEKSNTGGHIIVVDKDKQDEIYIAKMKLPCDDFSIDSSLCINQMESDNGGIVKRGKSTSLIIPKPETKTYDNHSYTHRQTTHDYGDYYTKEPIDKTEYKEIVFKIKKQNVQPQSST